MVLRLLFWIFCIFGIGIKCQKMSQIVENWFQGNLFTTNTDTRNTENSKKQYKHHKKYFLAWFSHLVPVSNKKNDICVIYPGYKCEI